MSCRTLFIYTGGTVGMVLSTRGLLPDKDFPKRLRCALAQPDLPVITLEPLIDSSSATPTHWQKIADLIIAECSNYDAFVILHGTDTLAYTAAALSIMLLGLPNPVILTGSQRPLGAENSDALHNIYGAFLAAREQYTGVSVFFHHLLLSAQSVRKIHTQADAAFIDKLDNPLALWQEKTQSLRWQRQPKLTAQKSNYLLGKWYGFQQGSVAMLFISPDMPASAFQPLLHDDSIRGVVLQSFGSGNLPERTDLHDALRAALARGVRIINTTQCLSGEVIQDAYATGAATLGIESGGWLTPEAAFVHLHCDIASTAY